MTLSSTRSLRSEGGKSILLKKLKLRTGRIRIDRFFAVKKLHHAELFIRNLHDADFSLFGKHIFCAPNVNGRILPTRTKTHINTKLKHIKTIVDKILSKS